MNDLTMFELKLQLKQLTQHLNGFIKRNELLLETIEMIAKRINEEEESALTIDLKAIIQKQILEVERLIQTK